MLMARKYSIYMDEIEVDYSSTGQEGRHCA